MIYSSTNIRILNIEIVIICKKRNVVTKFWSLQLLYLKCIVYFILKWFYISEDIFFFFKNAMNSRSTSKHRKKFFHEASPLQRLSKIWRMTFSCHFIEIWILRLYNKNPRNRNPFSSLFSFSFDINKLTKSVVR